MSQGGTAGGGNTPPIVANLTIVQQVFTSNGTYTATADLQYAIIEVLGGGGAGGGALACLHQQTSYGSGGGGGEYARGSFSASTIGASQAVTVGSGGIGASGLIGNTGGTSSVGALITAIGGTGGDPGSNIFAISIGGAGGTGGTGGTLRVPGSKGTNSYVTDVGTPTLYPNLVGMGGSSFFGMGGETTNIISTASQVPLAGTAGIVNGTGGGGAINYGPAGEFDPPNPALAGGNGADGIVIITEYVLT